MKETNIDYFYSTLSNRKRPYPLYGQIELTYRCGLDCIHCYCKGSEDQAKELTTKEWKEIIDEIKRRGCFWLIFTGGDPLIREDFLEIYAYAKKKCFIISIFTNGYSVTDRTINYLAKSPPYCIEITLNGITQETYESITQVKGSFDIVMENIKKIKEKKLLLLLKSNFLKQNKNEIGRIKAFADKFLGKSCGKYYFQYDPMIYPRLNGDKSSCNHRLSSEEILEVKRADTDIWRQYQKRLHQDFPALKRGKDFLYHCNSWREGFIIDPYARLKFCNFSKKSSVNLKTTSFKEGFYQVFPQVLKEKFKTNSKCQSCSLRSVCHYCPARAYLETGDEEAPVPYYCWLAQETARQMHVARRTPQTANRQLHTGNENSSLP